jgi:hypothetical protein
MTKVYGTSIIVMILILFAQVAITTASWHKAEETKIYADNIISRYDSVNKVNDSLVKVNKDLINVTSNVVSYYDSLKHRSDSLFDEMWVLSMEKQKYEMTFSIFAKYYPESAGKFAYIMTHRIR